VLASTLALCVSLRWVSCRVACCWAGTPSWQWLTRCCRRSTAGRARGTLPTPTPPTPTQPPGRTTARAAASGLGSRGGTSRGLRIRSCDRASGTRRRGEGEHRKGKRKRGYTGAQGVLAEHGTAASRLKYSHRKQPPTRLLFLSPRIVFLSRLAATRCLPLLNLASLPPPPLHGTGTRRRGGRSTGSKRRGPCCSLAGRPCSRA